MATGEIIKRKSGISIVIFIISLIVVGAVSGVIGYYLHPTPAGPPSVTLNGAGATFPFPFLSAVSTNYSRIHPNVQINYQPIGSGKGKTALGAKTVDFAASDAPLSASETSALPAAALTIPETIGAVVVAYNVYEKDGTTTLPIGLRLDANTIANIFLGNINNWNDTAIRNLNPSLASVLPSHAIQVVHRSDGSGTTFVFTGYLNSAPGVTWTPGQGTTVSWPVGLGASGNQGVAGVILGTRYTIGYVELAYALTNPMQYSFVQSHSDPNTFVKPTLTNVTYAVTNATSAVTLPQGNQSWASVSLLNANGADSYPITSFTYLLIYKELSIVPGMTSDKAKALVDFLWFTVHSGQAQGPPLAYVSLSNNVVAIDETSIESITFNGQTLPT